MDRFEAREAIVEWFRTEGLLEDVRDYTHEVGHSYRSHVPIEPYLSDQWYIAVKKPIPNCQLPIADCRIERTNGDSILQGHRRPGQLAGRLALSPLLDGRLQVHPRPLRQDLPYLAGEPPRLAHQPATLVGTSDSRLVAGPGAERPGRP